MLNRPSPKQPPRTLYTINPFITFEPTETAQSLHPSSSHAPRGLLSYKGPSCTPHGLALPISRPNPAWKPNLHTHAGVLHIASPRRAGPRLPNTLCLCRPASHRSLPRAQTRIGRPSWSDSRRMSGRDWKRRPRPVKPSRYPLTTGWYVPRAHVAGRAADSSI